LYMMGLGQGNRAAPPSWIQLSAVLVNVFKQLELGALVVDPITQELIHSMGTLFVDDTDLLGWQCRQMCLSATPLKRQTFVSVANMSEMSSRHVGDILLCRPIFWLSASCR
jgi:hypothetical protein